MRTQPTKNIYGQWENVRTDTVSTYSNDKWQTENTDGGTTTWNIEKYSVRVWRFKGRRPNCFHWEKGSCNTAPDLEITFPKRKHSHVPGWGLSPQRKSMQRIETHHARSLARRHGRPRKNDTHSTLPNIPPKVRQKVTPENHGQMTGHTWWSIRSPSKYYQS